MCLSCAHPVRILSCFQLFLTIKHANVWATFIKLLWTFRSKKKKKKMNQQESDHQRALTKPAFWAFNWKWIRNRRVKFPMKYTQGLNIFFKGCSEWSKIWVILSPNWWKEMIDSKVLQTQPHCLIMAGLQDHPGANSEGREGEFSSWLSS